MMDNKSNDNEIFGIYNKLNQKAFILKMKEILDLKGVKNGASYKNYKNMGGY